MNQAVKVSMCNSLTSKHDDKSLATMGIDVRRRMAKPLNGILGGVRAVHGVYGLKNFCL